MKVNNNLSKKHGEAAVTVTHKCSVNSLIRILRSKTFKPAYASPIAADSGINCFIEGREYQTGQCFYGDEADLILSWHGPIENVLIDEPFPLTPNILYNQERWRAIIPAGTNRENIVVSGFDATGANIGWISSDQI
ncbi:hypothetical protein [Microbulbifer aestuariivivens]|uniref:hypothetical protein n=1 Tax=Microbulbifer aestuariivivens TaxID=1908308 RepID=UPI0031E96C31